MIGRQISSKMFLAAVAKQVQARMHALHGNARPPDYPLGDARVVAEREDAGFLDRHPVGEVFHELVKRLEDKLGFDPFTRSDEGTLPLTVGDLVRVYEDAAAVA